MKHQLPDALQIPNAELSQNNIPSHLSATISLLLTLIFVYSSLIQETLLQVSSKEVDK